MYVEYTTPEAIFAILEAEFIDANNAPLLAYCSCVGY